MTATLKITLSDEILEALRDNKTINIKMAAPGGGGGRPPRGAAQPGDGTLPARILDWASGLGGTFRTADVEKRFKLSRAHASMLLSKLAGGAYPIRRMRRGVYRHTDAGAAGPMAGSARPREGSLPARILDWAQTRGTSFDIPDVVTEFGIKKGHASMELSKLANGARPIQRTGRGVYQYGGGAAPARRRKTAKKRK